MTENGSRVVPLCYPLDSCFDAKHPSPFLFRKTSCRRGYVATWKIEKDRLYLVSIEGTVVGEKPGSVADVFPGQAPPVLATWFTGKLPIGRGKIARRSGWDFVYETEETLVVSKGTITRREPLLRA